MFYGAAMHRNPILANLLYSALRDKASLSTACRQAVNYLQTGQRRISSLFPDTCVQVIGFTI
jgi:hypothetical protein